MKMKTKRGEFRNLIVIGIPTTGMVDIDFAINLVNLTMPVNTSPLLHVVRNKPVDEACNRIVKFALECNGGKGSDYVYFREDDVFTPKGAVERLIARDVDIISGTCFSKQAPPFPIIFRTYGGGAYTKWYNNPGDIIEVCGTGLACTLIKTDVFRHLDPPWFKTITYPESQPDVDDTKISRMTQDMYFYRRIIAKGFQVWVDTGVQCGHKDVRSGTVYYYDHELKLPAWLGPNDSKPQCIAPVSRSKRSIALTKRQRNENIEDARNAEAMDILFNSSEKEIKDVNDKVSQDGTYKYVMSKTNIKNKKSKKSIPLDEDSSADAERKI